MNKKNKAFSSIQVLFSLFFISIITISLYGILYTSRVPVEQEKNKIICQENLISIADKIKKDLLNDVTSDADSLVDSFWLNNFEDDKVSVKIEDLSSKMNINFFPKEIFLETNLCEKIELLDSYNQIEVYIENNGLIYSPAEISSIIQPEVYDTWFSSFGIANVNFVSQSGLEKLSLDLTGAADNVFLFLQKRDNLLKNKQLIQTETDFQFIAGVLYEQLIPIVSLQPAMNIHFIKEEVLEALLSYEPYKIKRCKDKKNLILEMRQSQEISRDKLIEILEITNAHPLYYILGTKTWFWKIEISEGKYIYQEILFCEPSENEKKQCYTISQKLINY